MHPKVSLGGLPGEGNGCRCRSPDPAGTARSGITDHELDCLNQPVGADDLFIAAHALTLGYTLVTVNE